MITEDAIRSALASVKYPGFSRDIVSFGLVKGVHVEGDAISVKISLATRDPNVPDQINREARAALEAIPGAGVVRIEFDIKEPPQAQGYQGGGGGEAAGGLGKASIPGVKKIIAVASGKGGVGKSTVAANLAVALARSEGAKVGLCDCDLYGPSIALMFGSDEHPNATAENEIIPIERYGVKLMSMGFLLQDGSPVIVRGPLATRYTQQFLRNVAWGDLDYLILDLPPGTGDIQLTIVQTVAVDGAVIVTTPQEVALIDARKAVSMFAKVNVPILGIVENMAYFHCPDNDKKYYLFGEGGGRAEAERLGVPLLAEIPIEMATREAGDAGAPIALMHPTQSGASAAFAEMAAHVKEAAAAHEV